MIPTLDRPVICSTDQGLASIREHNLPFKECKTYEDVREFVAWIKTPDAQQFATIVFDDFSEICAIYLKKALAANKDGRQAYGQMADEMLALLRELRDVNTHTVVLICKEERIQNQNLALVYSPMVPGKAVQPLIAYLFGQVYRMETYTDPQTRQSYPVIRCQKNDTCEAKDRSGKLGELEQAHLGQIIAKVMS